MDGERVLTVNSRDIQNDYGFIMITEVGIYVPCSPHHNDTRVASPRRADARLDSSHARNDRGTTNRGSNCDGIAKRGT